MQGPFAIKNGSLVLDNKTPWYWYYCSGYVWGSPTLNQQSECAEYDIPIGVVQLPTQG